MAIIGSPSEKERINGLVRRFVPAQRKVSVRYYAGDPAQALCDIGRDYPLGVMRPGTLGAAGGVLIAFALFLLFIAPPMVNRNKGGSDSN